MSSAILAPVHKRQLILRRLYPHPQQRRFLFLAVFSVALVVRLGPLLWNSALRGGSLQYDDGVYFAAAQHLVVGQLPYRDFVLLHPPGIALALAPLAALSHIIGDANAFAAARLLLIAVGAVNAALVAWIAGRQGAVAGAVGGLLYAVWWVAAGSETTVLLEPILNLLLLLAVALLTRQGSSPRRAVIAGMLVGASVGFKLWPVPVLLLLVAWLFWTSRRREACQFVVGCALSLAAIVSPFLTIAPRQMWNQVVIDQITRQRIIGPGQSIADRLVLYAGVSGHLYDKVPAALVYLVAAAALASIILLVRTVPHGWLWCGILCIQVAELLMAPLAGDETYSDFAAGSLAVLIGLAVGRGYELLDHSRRRRFVSALGIALVVLLISSMAIGMKRAKTEAVYNSALRSFAHQHKCVWATSTDAILADQESRNMEHGCDYPVDFTGLVLDENRAKGVVEKFFVPPTLSVWQRRAQKELARSDAAIVTSGVWQRWSVATHEYFLSQFKNVGHVGLLQLWSKR